MANTYINAKAVLATNLETTLYTCAPFSTAVVKSILVCEVSNSGDTLTLKVSDSSGTDFSLFDVKAIAGHATVELLTAPLVIQADEILKVTAGAANRLHIVASILEIS
jgi:hypothetical protein